MEVSITEILDAREQRVIHQKELLKRYGVALETVCDYHCYPVADNDAPALSADRLEYTMGNLWNYGFADLAQIRSAYEDLVVGTDEAGQTELVFRAPEKAAWFAGSALKNSRIYIADEDRFAMQALADLLLRAVERGVICREDLWRTEREVLAHLTADPVTKAEWDTFTRYARILRSPERPEEGYWVRIGAKRRWIDPYVPGRGRVSQWDASVAEGIEALKALPFDRWLSALPDGNEAG